VKDSRDFLITGQNTDMKTKKYLIAKDIRFSLVFIPYISIFSGIGLYEISIFVGKKVKDIKISNLVYTIIAVIIIYGLCNLYVSELQYYPRFSPVTTDELEKIDIEISILSPLEKIDDIEKIVVGKHGIIIKKNGHSGLLLPQVATEWQWDRKTFLEQTCNKANLPIDAYKTGAEILIFSATIFSEKN